jgi:hypothetical protein
MLNNYNRGFGQLMTVTDVDYEIKNYNKNSTLLEQFQK